MKSQSEPGKILYIITQGFWGGAQRYVFDLASSLPPESVTVAIGEASGPQDLQVALSRLSPPRQVLALKHLVRPIRPLEDLRAIFEIRKLYQTGGFTVVHLNSSKAGIIGSLAAIGLKNRPKIIYTVHGWVFLEPLAYPVRLLYRWLEKWTARFKDTLIILSEKEKRIGLSLNIPEKKLQIIQTGITTPKFYLAKDARQKLCALTTTKTPNYWVGTIANLFLTKGLDILIAAAAEIVHQKPGVHFFILGTGPEQANLENLIKKLKISKNIHLLGAVPEAAAYLKAFDVFVLPSRKEGLPYTIFEAMSAGIPIVATAVGGISGLLADYSLSTLCVPNNVRALQDALISNLNHRQTIDPKKVRTVEEMVAETIRFY